MLLLMNVHIISSAEENSEFGAKLCDILQSQLFFSRLKFQSGHFN